jgi:hypothetical protein
MMTLRLPVTVLAIDADGDDQVTEPCCKYRDAHVYPLLKRRGFAIERCQGPAARRCGVAPRAEHRNVVYITGSGHGTQNGHGDRFKGYQDEVIFQANAGQYSPAEVRGKIVHFLSCETAVQLGPDFVRNGCRAYFGYAAPFSFPALQYAKYFLQCDSEIDRGFADGLTAAQVQKRTLALFDRNIAKLNAMATSNAMYAACQLIYNRTNLRGPSNGTMYGSKRARL